MPILVTLLGIVTEVIPLFEKAPPSMLVAPLGTVRLVIRLHPENALLPMTLSAEFNAIELFAGGQTSNFV